MGPALAGGDVSHREKGTDTSTGGLGGNQVAMASASQVQQAGQGERPQENRQKAPPLPPAGVPGGRLHFAQPQTVALKGFPAASKQKAVHQEEKRLLGQEQVPGDSVHVPPGVYYVTGLHRQFPGDQSKLSGAFQLNFTSKARI